MMRDMFAMKSTTTAPVQIIPPITCLIGLTTKMTLMRMEMMLIPRTCPDKHFPRRLNVKNLMSRTVYSVLKSMRCTYQSTLLH